MKETERRRERKKDPVLFAFALKSVWCVLFLSRSHALPQNVRSTCFSFFFSKQAKIGFVHRMSIECAYLFALRWRSVGQKTIKKKDRRKERGNKANALYSRVHFVMSKKNRISFGTSHERAANFTGCPFGPTSS